MKKEIDLVEIVKSSEKTTAYDNTDPKGRELESISNGGLKK